ncbi:uncharacterized protein si:dkeyp-117h8.4 isoform X2 [Xiphias gladius]|uniref:uncharacterized protein si:dkeyp-117h8.4 isoform X2 n=1 Tax=Xiphias gladius TaxID=8245 RepID=UPI001A9A13E7|nr:uncharacterized protein si:dkeyp-117h8.4 isoform X2 [Xiphias gladius]
MDVYLKKQLHENSFSYKRSLDRIIDKYSKLYYQDGGVEVDLDQAKPQTVERYMKLAKVELNKLESKSLTELREDSLRAQDITRHSQLDSTHQDGGADETCVSSGQFSADGDGMARSDTTQLTVSSLDESQRNSSETELQPEDQDEELEMTLRSRGSSFVELYPSMISRIERAWHRQNVSEAADSVLRRYRRWRQQSNRSSLNNTFIVSLRHPNSNPRKVTMKTLLEENSNSPGKRQFMRLEPAPRSPLQIATNLQALQAQQLSPERERGSLRREQHRPILAMDLSGLSEISEPKEISLNETFTVSELSRLGEQPCPYPTSPSQPYYPTTKASLDLSLRSKRLSLSAHSEQATGRSTYESEIAAVKERPDTYSSPVRPSPLKARMMTSLDRSPHSFSRSPKEYSAESFSREPMRPRSKSTSLSSPPQKPPVPLRVLYPQESHLSPQPQLRSPQPAKAEGRLRLRRHLSFDSSLPSIRVSYSPKKLDEDFIKLYHKFVCQNQSFFNGPPCRLCARSSEASRGHSSSALAALALSPHRSVLRKRHRELGWGGHPQSKRSRDECCKSSPGSKRHGNEMLRRCLAPSELSHDGLSYSSSRHATFNKFSTQLRSADAHQEAWMRRGQPVSAAEFSGLGVSLERSIANGYPPSVQKMVVSTDHL